MSSEWKDLELEYKRNTDRVAVLRGEWKKGRVITEVELMLLAFGNERVLQCRYHKVKKDPAVLWHDGMWHATD